MKKQSSLNNEKLHKLFEFPNKDDINLSFDDIVSGVSNYYEKLIAKMPGHVYWLDANGCTAGCNQNVLDSFGLDSMDKFVGLNYEQQGKIVGWDIETTASFKADTFEVIKTGKAKMNIEEPPLKDKSGRTIFFLTSRVPVFNNKKEVIAVVGISTDITELKETQKKLDDAKVLAETIKIANEKQEILLEQEEKFTKVANQVAHDIRSPLASLLMVVKSCTQIPEADRIALREAAISIGDIANHLLYQYQRKENDLPEPEERQTILVSTTLLELLTSKKYQYQQLPLKFDSHFKPDTQFAFIKTELSAFKRMVSNLINNAVDALENGPGKVDLHLDANNEWVKIIIQDTGKGMPMKLIDKIMRKTSVTVGKKEGHGIGLMQVWETLDRNQGELHIHSELGKGTSITLTFPRMRAPNWIAEEIALTPSDTVIILDDDTSIHGAWRTRFESILEKTASIQLKHFEQGKEALKFIQALTPAEKETIFLLSDYELLKQELNGLHIIDKSQIKRSILVTSHYADPLVREQSSKIGTKILPKQLASEVPIKILEPKKDNIANDAPTTVDVVIVDDDKSFVRNLVLFVFDNQVTAQYHDPEHFLKNVHQYAKNTQIYLDNNFSNSTLKGLDIAKELHDQGYQRLYLLSGEVFDEGDVPSYLTVIKKEDVANIKDS